jgi:hypothetical protein
LVISEPSKTLDFPSKIKPKTLQGKVSRPEQFLVKNAGTWTAGKKLQLLFSGFARARQMNSTQPAEEKIGSRNTSTHSNSSSKWLLFALPVSFFWPPDAAQIPPGKIKFDARNFQKSVEKFKMLQKLSNFF